MPEEYGGAGADRLYSVVMIEEQAGAGRLGPAASRCTTTSSPYILNYGTEEQKQQWLPKMASSGELVTAIAMTEPGTGSDLQGIKTHGQVWTATSTSSTAPRPSSPTANSRPGDRGRKDRSQARRQGHVAHRWSRPTREGLQRAAALEKVGMKAQDTSELFFEDVRVPKANLLGEPKAWASSADAGAAAGAPRSSPSMACPAPRRRWPPRWPT
jgi:alkylation response protein AidB-like acyl-CoA dehydrogenase